MKEDAFDVQASRILDAMVKMPQRLTLIEHHLAAIAASLAALVAAQPPLLMTIPDAARLVGVSVPTMRRWVKTGRVKATKIGSRIRVDVSMFRGSSDEDVAKLAERARRSI